MRHRGLSEERCGATGGERRDPEEANEAWRQEWLAEQREKRLATLGRKRSIFIASHLARGYDPTAMGESSGPRWPRKCASLKVEDPFLKMLVAKYEQRIPWGAIGRDHVRLAAYVTDHMLPSARDRFAYPPRDSVRHAYVETRDVDLAQVLSAGTDPEAPRLFALQEDEGTAAATTVLVELMNRRKHEAFTAWVETLRSSYSERKAFQVLVLEMVYALSPAGNRRTVMAPDAPVLDWLFRRLEAEALLPNENLATLYCLKVADPVVHNGWTHVPAGPNARMLAAAARGSGWCVASEGVAGFYLADSSFYILRKDRQPVVALRVNDEGTVDECQGRHNAAPEGWYADIHLFLETTKLRLDSRVREYAEGLASGGELASKPIAWWTERVRLWPFCLPSAPPAMARELRQMAERVVADYSAFPRFGEMAKSIGIAVDPMQWLSLVRVRPRSFDTCPAEQQASPEVRAACLEGWIQQLKDGQATYDEIAIAPDFVRSAPSFHQALSEHLPPTLLELIRTRPRHRRDDVSLDRFVGPEMAPRLAREYMLDLLLKNETGNYRDEKLPAVLRERGDFWRIREEAWRDAVRVEPTLLFAAPDELRRSDVLVPKARANPKADLQRWVNAVEKEAGLLMRKTGVPKAIRWRDEILDAYVRGWCARLEADPWRLWITVPGSSYGSRVYMSYAILRLPAVIEALRRGWRLAADFEKAWAKASSRMQRLPPIQLSALRAAIHRPMQSMEGRYVAGRIFEMRRHRARTAVTDPMEEDPIEEEVDRLLERMGYSR